MYGMGNWADIASHICSKDQYECKEHYFKYYLNASVPIENLFDNISFEKKRVEYLNSAEYVEIVDLKIFYSNNLLIDFKKRITHSKLLFLLPQKLSIKLILQYDVIIIIIIIIIVI
jgi:hypothetical protein